MNWFQFKSTRSTFYDDIVVEELPPISIPPKRIEFVEIEGRDGDVLIDKGYKSFEKTVRIGLKKGVTLDTINAICGWLQGEGMLMFSNEPDKVYTGAVISQIDFERLVRFKQAAITFYVQPHKTKFNDIVTETDSALLPNIEIENSGNYPATPFILAEFAVPTGAILAQYLVDGNLVFLGAIPAASAPSHNYLVIDYVKHEAYATNEAGDSRVELTGITWNDYLSPLPVGQHTLRIADAGSITATEQIVVMNKSRWV